MPRADSSSPTGSAPNSRFAFLLNHSLICPLVCAFDRPPSSARSTLSAFEILEISDFFISPLPSHFFLLAIVAIVHSRTFQCRKPGTLRESKKRKAYSRTKICPTLCAPVCMRTLLRIRYAMPAHEQPVRAHPNFFLNPRNHPSSPATCTSLISRLIPGLCRHKTGVAQTTVRRCRKQNQHSRQGPQPTQPTTVRPYFSSHTGKSHIIEHTFPVILVKAAFQSTLLKCILVKVALEHILFRIH